jgi:hypothetical protein
MLLLSCFSVLIAGGCARRDEPAVDPTVDVPLLLDDGTADYADAPCEDVPPDTFSDGNAVAVSQCGTIRVSVDGVERRTVPGRYTVGFSPDHQWMIYVDLFEQSALLDADGNRYSQATSHVVYIVSIQDVLDIPRRLTSQLDDVSPGIPRSDGDALNWVSSSSFEYVQSEFPVIRFEQGHLITSHVSRSVRIDDIFSQNPVVRVDQLP